MTIRARLTLTYAALLLTIGAVLVALLYGYMRFVPTYEITSTVDGSEGAPTDLGPSEPALRTDDAVDPGTSVVITSAADVLDTILLASIVILVVLAAVGAWLGWVIAGRVLRPLQSINDAAKRAATGSLDHRVGLAGPHDEIRELSDTFDDMLERLEVSFQAGRRFAANASHELRTPLAATQVMLDVAISDPGLSSDELRTLAARLRETNSRNVQTVDALLDLSEISQSQLRHQPVALAETVSEAIRQVRTEAEAAGVTLTTLLEEGSVSADPVLLRQLATNLIENAIRHNHRKGTVTVSTGPSPTTDDWVRLAVVNTGPLIPADAVTMLTEPFYREEGRVSGLRRGHGLGLALVASIVDAHGGTLVLDANAEGGLTITVDLAAVRSVPSEVSG